MNNDNNTILGFDVNLICDFFLNTCLLYTSDAADE